MTYKIYTNDGKLFKTESSYCIALSYAMKDLDKFTIIADGYNSSGFKVYCNLPYIFDVLLDGKRLVSDFFDCNGDRFSVRTFFYDGHIYYIKIRNGVYEQFYRID